MSLGKPNQNTISNYNEFLEYHERTRVIGIKPACIAAFGPGPGILMSQILFWAMLPDQRGKLRLRVKRDGFYWIAKTYEEWAAETGLKPTQVEYALRVLRKMDVLITKSYVYGGQKQLHIRVNPEPFYAALSEGLAMMATYSVDPGQRNMMLQGPEQIDISRDDNKSTYVEMGIDISRNDNIDHSKDLTETNKSGKAANPEEKKQSTRGQYLDHPAVIKYRDVAHLTPPHANRELIVERFPAEGDPPEVSEALLMAWETIIRKWIAKGWNKGNIGGMIEKYDLWAQANFAPDADPFAYQYGRPVATSAGSAADRAQTDGPTEAQLREWQKRMNQTTGGNNE